MYLISKSLNKRINTLVYKFLLRTTYFGLLLISLMGPAFGVKNAMQKEAPKNVFLAIDMSASMQSTDIAPNRFELAKRKMLELVDALKNTKTGIIAFSSEAYIHAPISSDNENIKLYINLLNLELLEDKGTNLSAPILLAEEKFNQMQLSKDASNILVIFSDGGNYSLELSSITDSIGNASFNVFTCGIGKKNNSFIKAAGTKVNTKLESTLLIDIAQYFQGNYYELSSYQSNVKSLSTAINNIKSNQIDQKRTDYENNKYFYFLLIALILIILDILIPINIITT
jgi:Ca-activated chloride channel family protein